MPASPGRTSSEAVAAYLPLVESLAHKYVDKSGLYSGAEYDDLVQEGLIAVWQALEDERRPGPNTVMWAMMHWCRELSRQRGRSATDKGKLWESTAQPYDPDYLTDAIDKVAYDVWAMETYGG